jgi:hypothetical protein
MLGQLSHRWRQADGRNRDPPMADPQAVVVRGDIERGEDVVEIRKTM